MKTKLRTLAKFVDRLIRSVGLLTIMSCTNAHWPNVFSVATGISLGSFAAWYFWRFFLVPFKEALRGQH